MDLTVTAVQEQVADADAVAPVGSRTQWEVGDDPEADAAPGIEVRAPAGIVHHEPADLTVTVGAGTTVADLSAALGEHGQECPLDPRDAAATVGGVLACGLSGHRRLRHGPLRDRALEVRFVTGEGRLVKAGGPTVKNVSGYDLPRLLVGSLGTLGVIVQVTLRCQPLPKASVWATVDSADPFAVRRRLFRPSCIAWDGTRVWCLAEGHPADVAAEMAAAGLEADGGAPPPWPGGAYQGRASVRPGALGALATTLDAVPGLCWLAEVGVGTVHVAADAREPLDEARRFATAHGGWLLRERGRGLPGFGRPLPNAAVARRLKEAFDPAGKLNPGRLPL